ncbi:uncharacterized protein LOC110608544 [Manihot esculenta]|uniref:Uncharacterized protein n=4 Tax=Manihot esculenta TaxID=3983 RepID=A0A251LUW5_MANES|nr:uncharacterized protein LOC110608544 [Manihot esculenta]XP_021603488.1 uncharacterized protein LOC110608544 [Manihot esculenta]KAG8659739.1 hypothetical protein MANES_02G069500v8 [Manihot esculenta]KAG8659740.1 hypothetical protein MANES_02G069500v8 [Manihot esculenta]KAG8659741.1 hypothetical protein MANES_02G069500v8 [Manihot esculenta]OAY57087.1 hypothetical protein MANES_02G069500v8 [Manihot esculenta]OAY57088.1 hypothetical protein MANES_02G069500v8 [Manihot esculenta]
MAIQLCSDNSAGFSPRISFSHDLCLSDIVPVEQHPLPSNSLGSIDFDFCTRKSFDQESSSADELFSDGKILPTEIKKKTAPAKQLDQSSPPPHALNEDVLSKKESMKEMKGASDELPEEKHTSKSFWRFKRSSSLNCVSGYGRSLCPLPLLSRSNSTGSVPSSVKRVPLSRDSSSNHKQHRQSFMKHQSSSSSTSYQKPPLKKNYGAYGNGVRVSPVLNVPSGNLFGLGSIFFNGKDKNKKK